MYLLSNLVEEYLWSEANFNKRRNAIYLENWIDQMINSGYQCQAMYDFKCNYDITQVCPLFENVINELDLLKKCNATKIDEEFLFKISLYEYQNGYYDSACEFLYYKKYVAEKLLFPHTIKYSVDSDKYYINNMRGSESEEYVLNFLKNNNIYNSYKRA